MKHQTEFVEEEMRILTSAEPFGYGPCSKLVCVAKNLKNEFPKSRIDFLGENSALDFAQQNSFAFNNIREYDRVYPNPNNYNLVISAMNPYMILWGWFNRKKCIYLDSLYWFWRFEKEKFEKLEEVIDQLTNAESIDEVWAIVKDITGHHLHYIAYRLSSISCSQYFNDSERDVDIFRRNINNIVSVNPIIDTSFRKKVVRDTILISLGGLLSPLNQKKEALAYVNLILKITEEFISEASKKYKIILATNSEITRHIKIIPQGVTVASLSHEEMLKTINRCAIVLTSAGITTMYECLMYETPFFILPELHDGHYLNYLRLAGNDKKKIKKLQLIFPNSFINSGINNKQEFSPDDEIRNIQSIIKKLNLADNPTSQGMKHNLNKLLPIMLDAEKLRKMASEQRNFALGENIGKYKETLEIVKDVVKSNQLPAVQKKHLIGVISSAVFMQDKKKIDKFFNFGKNLAKNDINVATGAAIGISHLIGLGARLAGSKLIGFSPNSNALMHSKQLDNASINDFDGIHFDGNGFTSRSLKFISAVDALIMISGRMGTLSEFTIAFEEGVPILVLKGYGGISDRIEEIISFANKDGLVPPIITTDTNELINKLLEVLDLKYYK